MHNFLTLAFRYNLQYIIFWRFIYFIAFRLLCTSTKHSILNTIRHESNFSVPSCKSNQRFSEMNAIIIISYSRVSLYSICEILVTPVFEALCYMKQHTLFLWGNGEAMDLSRTRICNKTLEQREKQQRYKESFNLLGSRASNLFWSH